MRQKWIGAIRSGDWDRGTEAGVISLCQIMVTHCLCYNRSFAELKAIADRCGVKSIEQLQEHIDFGLNCRLCHPYVRKMLETGETVFEVMGDNPGDS